MVKAWITPDGVGHVEIKGDPKAIRREVELMLWRWLQTDPAPPETLKPIQQRRAAQQRAINRARHPEEDR